MRKYTYLFIIICTVLVTNPDANAQFFPPEFGVFGGFSFPAGDFSSGLTADEAQDLGDSPGKAGGRSRLGFSFGIEMNFPVTKNERLSWINSAALTSHPTTYVNEYGGLILEGGTVQSESWLLVTPLTGLQYALPVSNFVDIIVFGQGGILYGQSPELYLESRLGETATKESGASSAFAYSFGAGLHIHKLIKVDLRFLQSQPEYSVNTITQTGEETREFTQVTTMIQLVGGVTF